METIIKKPSEVSADIIMQILDLHEQGSQISTIIFGFLISSMLYHMLFLIHVGIQIYEIKNRENFVLSQILSFRARTS